MANTTEERAAYDLEEYMDTDQYVIDTFNLHVKNANERWDMTDIYNATVNNTILPEDANMAAWNAKLDELAPVITDFRDWNSIDEACETAMYEELEKNGWNWDAVDEDACYPNFDTEYYNEVMEEYDGMYSFFEDSLSELFDI